MGEICVGIREGRFWVGWVGPPVDAPETGPGCLLGAPAVTGSTAAGLLKSVPLTAQKGPHLYEIERLLGRLTDC